MLDINQCCQYANDGYRPNVGIILSNSDANVLWARRVKHDGWQFPQGGIEPRETMMEAAFRELYEEVGVLSSQVEIIGNTHQWLHYDLPSYNRFKPPLQRNSIKGQKQVWFLFRFLGCDTDVCLDISAKPEFDKWKWVNYWEPLRNIVRFKKNVYQKALQELEPYLALSSDYHPNNL